MRKKLLQTLAVCMMSAFIFSVASCTDGKTVAEPTYHITNVAGSKVVEETIATCTVEKIDIPVVAETIEEEPVEEIVEEPYYVEIIDGYITEDSLISICEYVGEQYDISPKILQAVAYTESSYKVNATGSSNDSGLCQIVPRWNHDRIERLGITDIYDPYDNILCCADILAENRNSKYGSDIRFVLMAYNMGKTGATKPYESGVISNYAKKVLEKAYEFGY